MARSIAYLALEEARRSNTFHGSFHGFVVDASSCRVYRGGRPARLSRVVIRLGEQVLDQQTLVDFL
jgi:hypothetical protein